MIKFLVMGGSPDWPSVSFSNDNAREVLGLLGFIGKGLPGSARGLHMQKACQKAFLLLEKFGDPAIEPKVVKRFGEQTITSGGREAGYLTKRVEHLLQLAQRAGDLGVITWTQTVGQSNTV
jgi:hypothetical protein